MNFELTEEQLLIVKTAREFATATLAPRAQARDRLNIFPDSELKQLAELGLLGVNVPEALGGVQAGTIAYALALTEVAAADASVAVAMAVTNMVAELICTFGSDEQKAAYVPKLCSGEALCGAFGLSEPGSGSDAGAMRTTATATDEGYRLDGSKLWITSGDRAGVLIVWARTDGGAGLRPGGKATSGISAFIVPGGTPGMSAGQPEHKLGLHGSTTVPLTFDGCVVPKSALLGRVGDGFKLAMAALDGGRIGIASQAVGVARAAFTAAKDYAQQRQQFGQPIAQFQAIQNMLADAATQLEAARLLVLRAAYLKQQGVAFSSRAAMAKLYASEMAGRVCDMALQVHGGYGYTEEFPVERYLRDARVQRIYEGTSEIQRLVIARSLLKEFVDHV